MPLKRQFKILWLSTPDSFRMPHIGRETVSDMFGQIFTPVSLSRCGKPAEYVVNDEGVAERVPCVHLNELHWVHSRCCM